jgi:hypothetical protein
VTEAAFELTESGRTRRYDSARNEAVTDTCSWAHMLRDMSPTIHVEDGFRFSFWMNERGEPPHVHVYKADAEAKWWLLPVREAQSFGFNPSQRARIRDILEEHGDAMLERWYATHDKS